MFLFIGNITFAQKVTSSDTTQKKNLKGSVSNKTLSKEDQRTPGGQDLQKQEPKKDDRSTQDTRYTAGASGVKRSISYKFSKLNTDSDPGNGIFRYNNNNVSEVTYIFVDNNDLKGEDQTKWYSTWEDTTGASGRGQLTIVENEGKNVNVFDVIGVFADGKGFWKIPVRYVSGTLPADGSVYYYIFNRIAHKKPKADKVDQGTQTVQVTQPVQTTQPAQTTPPVQDDTTGTDNAAGTNDTAGTNDPAGTNDTASTDNPAGTNNPAGTDNPASTNDHRAGTNDPAGTDNPAGTNNPASTDNTASPNDPASSINPTNLDHPVDSSNSGRPDRHVSKLYRKHR